MTWSSETSCGNETDKIKYLVVPYTRGCGLDLGCGLQRLWPSTLGIDRQSSPQGATLVRDIGDLSIFASNSLDYIFSSHALEDFAETATVLAEWWRVIRPGGFLVLYLPHEDHYPKIGEPGCNPAHRRNLNNALIINTMKSVTDQANNGACLEINETRHGGDEYSFLQVFRKITEKDWRSHHDLGATDSTCTKRALVIRYGGFGDILQASSIFPGLRRQGYQVWVNTTPKGRDILAHDPHIDGWWIQDENQVPNADLYRYWQALGQKFDRVINLSESVEGTLLTLPSRMNSHWSPSMRALMLNKNYTEVVHALAEVPMPSALHFYPTPYEQAWVTKQLKKLGGKITILWCLSGSSVHKAWPFVDSVIAHLLHKSQDYRFVLVGDTACQLLEKGWEAETRVWLRSGLWPIRKTLAFAGKVDIVIGPETGILNAVSLHDVAKILFLSHSSQENLSKHWKNTINLSPPPSVQCHPCHRLHYGWEHCHQDKTTGAALCSAAIEPGRVTAAIEFFSGNLCHDQRRSHHPAQIKNPDRRPRLGGTHPSGDGVGASLPGAGILTSSLPAG